MDELLSELIAFVKQASPALWQIAQQQVRVEAIQGTIGFALLLAATALCAWVCVVFYRGNDDSDLAAMVLGAVIGIIALVWSMLVLVDTIGRWLNPDFYAIQILVGLVKP